MLGILDCMRIKDIGLLDYQILRTSTMLTYSDGGAIWQSTEKVLIMVYMDGVRLNDVAKLKELGVNMQELVESITRSYAHQIYVDGFFNADPHPGQHCLSKLIISSDS